MTDNIILIHSKYSAYSKRLLKIANDIPHVKKICIDNKKIRNYILVKIKIDPPIYYKKNYFIPGDTSQHSISFGQVLGLGLFTKCI